MTIDLDALLKVWAVLSVFVIGGLQLWVRAQIRVGTDAVLAEAKALHEIAMEAQDKHEHDPLAHPNHSMTPVIRDLHLKVVGELAEIRTELRELRKAHDDAVKSGLCLYQHGGRNAG